MQYCTLSTCTRPGKHRSERREPRLQTTDSTDSINHRPRGTRGSHEGGASDAPQLMTTAATASSVHQTQEGPQAAWSAHHSTQHMQTTEERIECVNYTPAAYDVNAWPAPQK
ncbi:hypothetical protein NDU88_000681 [Pleurodeles waltl]|uniref:Uncharacterized protein n=1 Tax=Pleurodeles waltl TaxID=8319 RepID=A0AAV7LXJ3_PLEWA|nr:hypothetical protein NDU88_000681 [Pleurodeles waltl]